MGSRWAVPAEVGTVGPRAHWRLQVVRMDVFVERVRPVAGDRSCSGLVRVHPACTQPGAVDRWALVVSGCTATTLTRMHLPNGVWRHRVTAEPVWQCLLGSFTGADDVVHDVVS